MNKDTTRSIWAVVLLVGLLALFLWVGSNVREGGSREVPEGMREYRSTEYGFSLLYPQGMEVKEFDEGDGAKTITFEDTENTQGFQLFIVPYGKEEISAERFASDLESGIIEDKSQVRIGRVRATVFGSVHPMLGETREVWFVYNKYLFEATTLRGLEPLLTAIIKTWRFI